MQLTVPETIQLLRRRNGLNQAELGVKAFGLTPNSARTKIKNIELGLQLPSPDETAKLADALSVQPEEISPAGSPLGIKAQKAPKACSLTPETVQLFPGLREYVDMLNHAVSLGDQDLIGYIAAKLSALFANNYKNKVTGQP